MAMVGRIGFFDLGGKLATLRLFDPLLHHPVDLLDELVGPGLGIEAQVPHPAADARSGVEINGAAVTAAAITAAAGDCQRRLADRTRIS